MEKIKFVNRYLMIPFVFILFIITFYLIYDDIKKRTIKEFENEQLILAETASRAITSVFSDYQSDLIFLSKFKSITDFSEESKTILENFYEQHKKLYRLSPGSIHMELSWIHIPILDLWLEQIYLIRSMFVR